MILVWRFYSVRAAMLGHRVFELSRTRWAHLSSASASAFLAAASGPGAGKTADGAPAKPPLAPQDQIHQRIAGRKRFYKKVSVESIRDAVSQFDMTLEHCFDLVDDLCL